jgi:membrane protease YdiL (CAAX protease family)
VASSLDPVAPQTAGTARRPELAIGALWVTAALYLGYAALGLLPIPGELRYLGLIAAFFLLPAYVLRSDPARIERWQVGPGILPPWSRRGGITAALWMLAVFPIFVIGFLWFYERVCGGDTTVLQPVLWLEAMTPAAGSLEQYLARFCRSHGGDFWPDAIRVPSSWLAYGGLGVVLEVAKELFTIALPEEVFHRGYLMSALEERWPPSRRVFGVPFGLAAVLASLVFALGHLVGEMAIARLATFFPSLLFSFLWRRSGSLWAPALFHAGSNVLMSVLLASTFGR